MLSSDLIHSMEMIKNAPEWMQNMNLLLFCKMDKSGHAEGIARILAAYGIPPEKVMPCLMDIMLEFGDEME